MLKLTQKTEYALLALAHLHQAGRNAAINVRGGSFHDILEQKGKVR